MQSRQWSARLRETTELEVLVPRVQVNALEKFWSKVDQNGPVPQHNPSLGNCWIWTGYVLPNGYVMFRPPNENKEGAHRWIYKQLVGEIPTGFEIDHICRNTRCVRWSHLEAVTPEENKRRVRGLYHGWNAKKTHCKYGHEFNEENTRVRRNGDRICRTCHMLATRVRRQRKRKVVET